MLTKFADPFVITQIWKLSRWQRRRLYDLPDWRFKLQL